MIYDFGLAWRNIRNRPVQSLIVVLVVALAIALSLVVVLLADGVEEGIIEASDPFGTLVVGRAGSAQELVLSSILLQGNPPGNISWQVYDQLKNDEHVQLAVPLAFGDNVGGARIIGTNHTFFALRRSVSAAPAFQVVDGRLFKDIPYQSETKQGDEKYTFEAVLGAAAAARLGLRIGDTFRATHGIEHGIEENVHDDIYVIVGILGRTRTAYDTAVYTHLQSIWDTHADLNIPTDGRITLQTIGGEVLNSEPETVTAVLVLPVGFIEMNQIAQQFYLEPTLQAAFPGDALSSVINLLRQLQTTLNVVGYLVLGMASLTLFLSMYSAILAREQSIAIMRSLGSRRITVVRVILFETLFIAFLGIVLGHIIAYLGGSILAEILSHQLSIPVAIRTGEELAQFGQNISAMLAGDLAPSHILNQLNLLQFELLVPCITFVLAILAALLPAWMAYQVNVIEKLFPS